MNSKFSHLCLLSAVIRSVYHHPLLSKIPENTVAYHFKILCICPKTVGVICKFLQVMPLSKLQDYSVRCGVTAPSLPGSYFGTWLKECPHLKFMVTVFDTKNRDIDRSIMLTLVCFKTEFLFLALIVLKLNL